MKKNILLIGFMGIGKGTTARAYAKRYDKYNIDTDDLIESALNKDVRSIFEKYGEAYFREMEQKTANWIEKSVNKTLISCGGGFYKVDNINRLGVVVLLDASFDWIYQHLKNAKNSQAKFAKRPLYNDIQKAKELYNEREKAYKEVADVVINVESKSMKEVLREIKTKVKEVRSKDEN